MHGYHQLGEIEHVLLRSDMYGTSNTTEVLELFGLDDDAIIHRRYRRVNILQHIFNEVLSNAIDNHARGAGTTQVKVNFSPDCKAITVWNNGNSIPLTVMHGTGKRVPTVVFGQLRSGSNFNDAEERQTGGRNGIGVKLANIWSKSFRVTVVHEQKKFTQLWTNNMSTCGAAKIVAAPGKKDSVEVVYEPDFERMGCLKLTSDDTALMAKRALDAVLCYDIDVRVNGKRLFKTAGQYLQALHQHIPVVDTNEHWKVAVFPNSHDDFRHMSFANAIPTSDGGTHVTHVLRTLTKILSEGLMKAKLKPAAKLIKDSLFLVVCIRTPNPVFDSQGKTRFKTRSTAFAAPWVPGKGFVKKLLKSQVFAQLVAVFSARQALSMHKNDGRKTKRVKVKKLIDASYAGTARSAKCTLFLAEGDSARAMLLKGVIAHRLQKTTFIEGKAA
jgi:DNA topoisomerase-2